MCNNKITFLGVICMTLIGLFACSGTPANGGFDTPITPAPKTTGSVSLSSMSTIPMSSINQGASFYMELNNNTNTSLKFAGYNSSSLSSLFDIDTTLCSTVASGDSCTIKITPKVANSGAVLDIKFSDSNNKIYTTSQVINTANNIASNNGIEYLANSQTIIANSNELISFAVPFLIDKNADNVVINAPSALSTQLLCNGSGFTAGQSCTAIVRMKATATNSGGINIISTRLGAQSTVNMNYLISVNNNANLVSSAYNVLINPANGLTQQTLSILNTGLGATTISNILPTPSGTVNLVNGQDFCSGQSLDPNASCTFKISANSVVNGQGNITIISTANNLNINLQYVSATPAPNLVVTNGASLMYSTVNQGSISVITLNNTGNTNFTAVKLPTMSAPFSITGGTCVNNNHLFTGESCTVAITYLPMLIVTIF